MAHTRRWTGLLAGALALLVAMPAMAQPKALLKVRLKARTTSQPSTAIPTRPAGMDHLRMDRPKQAKPRQIRPSHRPALRQTSRQPRALNAKLQRTNDVRRIASPVLPGIAPRKPAEPRTPRADRTGPFRRGLIGSQRGFAFSTGHGPVGSSHGKSMRSRVR